MGRISRMQNVMSIIYYLLKVTKHTLVITSNTRSVTRGPSPTLKDCIFFKFCTIEMSPSSVTCKAFVRINDKDKMFAFYVFHTWHIRKMNFNFVMGNLNENHNLDKA
eukprot:TRINITY_DN2488_c0_g1_i7.p1 TRINITY_DN2488_c0_g1~~TRINITY_DN2488_c0_g1_i7.p1  ORF type:complete len:107 (-),score=7.87 TRINITY_DN2488_c0_g1_i7:63-383(-)